MSELLKEMPTLEKPQLKQNNLADLRTESMNIVVQYLRENPQLIKDLEDLVNHDDLTFQHSLDTSYLAYALSKEAKLNKEETELVTIAAHLHDIGKLKIGREIIQKPGALTEEQKIIMQNHVKEGCNIINKHNRDISNIVYLHHQFKANESYPGHIDILPNSKIKMNIREAEQYKQKIIKLGKILAIADTFDALSSVRPYNKGGRLAKKCGEMMKDEEDGIKELSDKDKQLIDFLVELKKNELEVEKEMAEVNT